MSIFSNHEPPRPKNGSNGSSAMIDLRNVDKYYQSAAGDYHALKGIDLCISAGEFVSIIGKSGSGKSTLLNMITGIDRPTSGEVFVNGTAIHEMTENQLAGWRGESLGIVFQFFQMLPALNLKQNVILPMDLAGKYTARERRERAEHLLELVGLTEHMHKLPSMVSGGQQQRAAMARALANDPPLIIADEPTGNLDSKTAATVFALFNQLVREGKTVIIVTHDSSLAKHAHRTALIADGEIVNEYVAKAMPTLLQDQMLWATRNAKTVTYPAGSMIVTAGTNADTFYIVSKGMVEVVLPRINQSDVIAMQLGPGKFFGEMAFFHDRKRQASVRASERGAVEVLTLSYDQLDELLRQSESTRDLLRQIAVSNAEHSASLRAGAS